MHVAIAMLGKGAGGIEQAFVDHCEALRARGNRITAIVAPGAQAEAGLARLGFAPRRLSNLGEWDPLAAWRLRRFLSADAPDVVLTHGGRAFALARKAVAGKLPLVAVAHNYAASVGRFVDADGVLAITADLATHLVGLGIQATRIHRVPNMIRCPASPPSRPARRQPPVVGSLGRFVAKKGFDVFIDALAILKGRGIGFSALLGGGGAEDAALRARAAAAGLDDQLRLPGWIADRDAFYQDIDIFCLPSLHEPFGIVLLEAFARGVPVVATASEGPRDFLADGSDSLVVPIGNAVALADALARLIADPALAEDLAARAFAKARDEFAMDKVGARLEAALRAARDQSRVASNSRSAAATTGSTSSPAISAPGARPTADARASSAAADSPARNEAARGPHGP